MVHIPFQPWAQDGHYLHSVSNQDYSFIQKHSISRAPDNWHATAKYLIGDNIFPRAILEHKNTRQQSARYEEEKKPSLKLMRVRWRLNTQ